MQAGTQDDALRRVVDRLRGEFVDPKAPWLPGIASSLAAQGGIVGLLEPEDEETVARLREALAGIAGTLAAETGPPPLQEIDTALDGAEFVIRGELAAGDPERVLKLLPSFVFLVALSVADQDRALELSGRTAELVEEAGGPGEDEVR